DFFLPVATGLRLVSRQITNTNLVVATSGITYPLTNGTVSITSNSGTGTFLPFFNWKFAPIKGLREEVVVNVKPIATLSTISPTTIASGGSDFALTVNGTNFVNGESIVRWNGTDRATTFVSSTELSAAIPAADIATGGTASVTVFNSCGTTTGQTISFLSVCAPVADLTVLPTITGQCSADTTAPTATSSCTGAVIGTTSTVFPITTQGTTIVTWTYNDGNGNTSTQNQTVIVDDTVAPVADVTTLANALGQTSVTVTAPTATDACVGTIIGTTPSPLTYSTQGTFNIVWTYNDGNGNTATQNQTVIVADTIAPTAPTSLVASGTTSNSTNLSWTASSDNAAVTGYDVYNGATLIGTTASASFAVSGLSASTAYTFSVKAKDAVGNISASSNAVNVTTLTATYCASTGTSVASESIGKVVFGSINNTSTGGTGYVNFTAISTNATRGTAYTITITPTWSGAKRFEGYAVWIDYNGDGDFADAGELAFSTGTTKTTPVSGTFTIPATATLGATRMRVSMKYNAIPTMCETFASGQVEDYTVNIVSSVAKIANVSGKAITEIKLYPNPTTSILNVSSVSENATFKVYNMLGQSIMNGKLSNGLIDVSNISSGIYLLEVTDKELTSVNRFIKQ
ncbi:GEVED domain-containing protein, partial [Flavobacterium sp.]|uniref:GEVED domain-containing protein n=1 Tax=Flavobacterium sp. TaxID=239 RepID=UPI00374FDBD6